VVHGPVPRPDLGLGRGLDRRLLPTPGRSEEQGLVRERDRCPEQMLFRATEQGLERRPLPKPRQTPERGPRRTSLQEPEQTLQRALERGPVWGKGLPQPSRGREKLGQCRSQNADTRSLNSRKGKDLENPGQSAVCQR